MFEFDHQENGFTDFRLLIKPFNAAYFQSVLIWCESLWGPKSATTWKWYGNAFMHDCIQFHPRMRIDPKFAGPMIVMMYVRVDDTHAALFENQWC